ncbi:DUF5134 domain-containing protein [Nocardia sp. NPDC057668]|uniref:DUF5134 domain-containing protein n=1 Tax=Nocardia sp. NPDC057668 TaxID=3346202 RepID=UPI00366BA784
MAEFVREYGMLRWVAVLGFVVAAVIVLARLSAVRVLPVEARGVDATGGTVAVGGQAFSATGLAGNGFRGIDRESDAAHLLMCLVMLAMLVFPAADPRALNGVLTAMTVVYAGLLLARIARWRAGAPAGNDVLPGTGVTAFAYHVVAAAAMLYAMSGHTGAHHAGAGPAPAPMLALAALFLADAALMSVPASRRLLRHAFPHPVGATGPAVVLPHVVMDLGTAFMLVAAASA